MSSCYEPIATSVKVERDDRIQFKIVYSCPPFLCPTASELKEGLEKLTLFKVESVDQSFFDTLFDGHGATITGTVNAPVRLTEIIEQIRNTLNSFLRIWSTNFERVEIERFCVTPKPPSPTTAIVFIAIAIIALVVFLGFRQVRSLTAI